MMKGICLRYASNEEEAEDILQDTFIQVFKKIKHFDGRGALGGWMRKVTVNKALEQYRKNKSIQNLKEKLMITRVGISTDDSIFDRLGLEELLGKIQKLSPGYRTVFNLYAVEGYNHQEIAKLLSISEGTSKSQYSRARQQLIIMIEEEQLNENKGLTYAKR